MKFPDPETRRARAIVSKLALCSLLFCLVFVAGESPAVAAQVGSDSKPPAYTAASVVNAATQQATGFAPYTIATVYGNNLSFTTRALLPADTPGGYMPNNLDGVDVYVNRSRTALFYVSPTQINFLIPAELLAGDYEMQVLRNGVYGPVVILHLDDFAPGLFVYNGNTLIATHADGSLITDAQPASQGEIIVVYAVGLGPTNPRQDSLIVPTGAAALVKTSPIQVLFDSTVVSGTDILYAGVTPGCTGLYQVNVRVPKGIGAKPGISIRFGKIASPAASLNSIAM